MITSRITFFPDFQYGFRISHSTTDLLAIVSNRIAKVFNMLMELELQHLVRLRFLTALGILVFFTNTSLIEFFVMFSALSFLFISQLKMASGGFQEIFVRAPS